MKPKVYIETSVASYLTSHLSRDLIIVARQELTRERWPSLISQFDVYVSALVVEEAGQGDPEASSARLKALDGIPVLDVTDAVKTLARKLVQERIIPDAHLEDALHVAVAAINGMDFLLTWNCRHLANAELIGPAAHFLQLKDYDPPLVCTPEELMGGIER